MNMPQTKKTKQKRVSRKPLRQLVIWHMENQEPEEADYAWLLAKANSEDLSLVEYLKSNPITYDEGKSILDEFTGNSTAFTDHMNSTEQVKGYKSKKARRLSQTSQNNVNNGATNNNVGLNNVFPNNSHQQPQQQHQPIHQQQQTFQNTSSGALATLTGGMYDLSIDQMNAASSNDGQRECPPPLPTLCEYVEDVTTVKSVVQGCSAIVVKKPSVEASLGITFSDPNEGGVTISGIEDGSPMGGKVETGMAVLAVNGTKVTSREDFLDMYGKCLGEVEIMVGPKNMTEAVKTIETLDSEKKGLEKKKTELEARVRKLISENEDLHKENEDLKFDMQLQDEKMEKERAFLYQRIDLKNKQLAEQVNLDFSGQR